MVCLLVFPALRPFGLPSHSYRLNGAGLTGLPALVGLKQASCLFPPERSACSALRGHTSRQTTGEGENGDLVVNLNAGKTGRVAYPATDQFVGLTGVLFQQDLGGRGDQF